GHHHPGGRAGEAVQALPPHAEAKAGGERGWGLGLTVVRGIVEAHGGIVKVESYTKEGTTFTIDLPVTGPRGMPAPEAIA
ncbi:MAG TPA: ATP-binding protein, partial [Myxococcales bacterium]|nr:ATP-binding protein [Myxococcales bacterium]